jgi:hypothetical protein
LAGSGQPVRVIVRNLRRSPCPDSISRLI